MLYHSQKKELHIKKGYDDDSMRLFYFFIAILTGWERTVHVSLCAALWTHLCPIMSGIDYFCVLK